MSTVNEVVPYGATVSYSTNLVTPSYTDFGMIVDIGEEKWSAAEINSTRLSSVAKTSQPGLPDYGEENWDLRYQKELISVIKGWMDNKTVVQFKVTIPDLNATATPATTPSTAVFQGWVKDFTPFTELEVEKFVDSKITIRITGPVIFTPGS